MAAADPVTHARIYLALKSDILSRRFPPFHRLAASEIARGYQVSLTPVREAIYRLVGEGLIDMPPAGGFNVSPLGEQALIDMLEMNQKLLVMGISKLRDATRLLDLSSTPNTSPGAMAAVDALERLFEAILCATGNDAIVRWGRVASERLRWVRIVECEQSQRAQAEYFALVELAIERDLTRLGRQLLNHHRRLAAALRAQATRRRPRNIQA